MFKPLNELLENFSKILDYQEAFVKLCRDNPGLAIPIVFILLIFIIYLFYDQSKSFFEDLRIWWKNQNFKIIIIVFLFVLCFASFLIVYSVGKVAALQPNIKVPGSFIIDPPGQPTELSVLGTKLQLEWDYQEDNKTGKYAICYAKSQDFRERRCIPRFTKEKNYIFQKDINDFYYWQIAALGNKKECEPNNITQCNVIGKWSFAKKISQYSGIDQRIATTGQVLVGISNSPNQGLYLLNSVNPEQILEYDGLDYKIAKKVVEKFQESLNSNCKVCQNRNRKCELCPNNNSPLKLKLQPIVKPWTELLDLPRKGQVDMIISTISYRPSRESKYSIYFSSPYDKVTQSLVYTEKNDLNTKKIADIFSSPTTLGVQVNSTEEELANEFVNELKSSDNSSKLKLLTFPNTRELIDSLKKSNVDYILINTPFAEQAKIIYPEFEIRELKKNDYPQKMQNQNSDGYCNKKYQDCMTSEYYVIAVSKTEKNSKFLEIINKTIDYLQKSQEFDEMKQTSSQLLDSIKKEKEDELLY